MAFTNGIASAGSPVLVKASAFSKIISASLSTITLWLPPADIRTTLNVLAPGDQIGDLCQRIGRIVIGIVKEDPPRCEYGRIIFKDHHAVQPYRIAGTPEVADQVLRRTHKFGEGVRYRQVKIRRRDQPCCKITSGRIGATHMLDLKKRFRRIHRIIVIKQVGKITCQGSPACTRPAVCRWQYRIAGRKTVGIIAFLRIYFCQQRLRRRFLWPWYADLRHPDT